MIALNEDKLMAWEEVVRELREGIPGRYPGWSDHNLHDPGITILELLAWLAQAQMYHASRLGEQHWHKYLKLLGIERRRRTPAHTLVTVDAREGHYLPAGTRFYAGGICFETIAPQMVEEGIFRQFLMTGRGREERLAGDWISCGKGLSLYPFGERPAPGNCFTVELHRTLGSGLPYRLFTECGKDYPVTRRRVDEAAYDGHDFYPLLSYRLEYLAADGWQPAAVSQDDTYGFMQDGSICFTLPEPMDETSRQLRFVLERSDCLLAPKITRISLAMAEVWQQETCENYAEWQANGLPNQQYGLDDVQMAEEQLLLEAEHELFPGQMDEWQQVTDFDRSGPEDRHYQLRSGVIRFGDGFRGLMPEGRIRIKRLVKTYGEAGNIKSGTIRRMAGTDLMVTNERNVTGGTAAEKAEEALRRYATEEQPLMRAVTCDDYRKLVLEIPGLMIADCHVYCEAAEQRELCIAVMPYTADGYGYLNQAYETNLYRYLEEKRLIGTRLRIVSPVYFWIEITCVAEAKAEYRNALDLIEQEIRLWIEKKGFGERLRQGELQGRIGTLACVRRVEALWLEAGSQVRRSGEGDLLLPPNGRYRLKNLICRLIGT